METKSVVKMLREARHIAIRKAVDAGSDLADKIAWQNRRDYLMTQERYFDERSSKVTPPKTVFISYSKQTGEIYFQYLAEKLLDAKFEVVTGFGKLKGDGGNVLSRVLGQMRLSSLYMGLLTKEIQVNLVNEANVWAPSVWVMEEKGMALAMSKPFTLMVEAGIHGDFWLKTASHKVHNLFTAENYREVTRQVVETLEERYEEVAMNFLNRQLRGSRFWL